MENEFGEESVVIGVIGTFVILAGSCFFDIREKRIPLQILIVGGIWAFIYLVLSVINGGADVLYKALPGLLPGAGLLLLGYLTEHKVGYGDGILLMIIGLMEGAGAVFLLFCIALFLQSVLAVLLVIIKKADKQTQIPFVPFLLLARIILLFD